MARRLHLGQNYSPFEADTQRHALHECLCSIFLPGNHEGLPASIASSYRLGHIRIHDTTALTMFAVDNIPPTYNCTFPANQWSRFAVQLNYVQTDSDTVLLSLGGKCDLEGWKLGTKDKTTKPEKIFCLPPQLTANPNCFTVDPVQKRIFTGGTAGSWRCWDMQTLSSAWDPVPLFTYQAHDSCILDGDYCQGLLATSSEKDGVCVWDVRSQSCVAAFDPATGRHLPLHLRGRTQRPLCDASLRVKFDKTGRHVVASSKRKQITVWNIRADAAQCQIKTDSIPYIIMTAKDSVFYNSGDEFIWRYSMFDAEMQRLSTSISGINSIDVDKENEQMMVVSGAKDSIELLTLEGTSIGRAMRRTERSSPRDAIFSPIVGEGWTPTRNRQDGVDVSQQTERSPAYSPTSDQRWVVVLSSSDGLDDLCESGSEMDTEEEDEGEYSCDEDMSSDYAFSDDFGEIRFEEESVGESQLGDHDPTDSAMPADLDLEVAPVSLFLMSDSDLSIPLDQDNANCDLSSYSSDEGNSEEEG